MKINNGKTAKIYVTGQWAFIPVEKGTRYKNTILYVKVPSCVVYVDCPSSRCGAKAGERCNGSSGPTTAVHLGRKKRARRMLDTQPEFKIQNCGPMRIG